jgi:hypothetical protein
MYSQKNGTARRKSGNTGKREDKKIITDKPVEQVPSTPVSTTTTSERKKKERSLEPLITYSFTYAQVGGAKTKK